MGMGTQTGTRTGTNGKINFYEFVFHEQRVDGSLYDN